MATKALQRWDLLRVELRSAPSLVLPTRWQSNHVRMASSMPTVAQPSFWKSLVPKPLRSPHAKIEKKPASKGWNPATFFIVIFLLIGSMSIQMISLKKEFAIFIRQSDVRIGLLREVVEKIQKGEKVDVERVLGAGDPAKEKEWEEVLTEIEREEVPRPQKKQDKPNQPETSSATKVTSAHEQGKQGSRPTASFF